MVGCYDVMDIHKRYSPLILAFAQSKGGDVVKKLLEKALKQQIRELRQQNSACSWHQARNKARLYLKLA
jgi:hypothetical protein